MMKKPTKNPIIEESNFIISKLRLSTSNTNENIKKL